MVDEPRQMVLERRQFEQQMQASRESEEEKLRQELEGAGFSLAAAAA